jgi:hypothetical protein
MWRETGDGHGVTLVATEAELAALGIDTRSETIAVAEPAKVTKPKQKQKKPVKSAKPKIPEKAPRATRTDSKQARLIAMLKRAKGASIDEIVEAMHWKPHTVRGAIAGALKKKLGLNVTSVKDDKRGRVYEIAP